MRKVADFISGHMSVIVLAVALSALLCPQMYLWIKPGYISVLLSVVMFGMGMNLSVNDFKVVFSRPGDVLAGVLAQFIIMPCLAWILVRLFRLPQDLAIGVILVGCCPGGTSSNVMTYLARGDLALSVGMTIASTLLSPVLTPLLTLLIAGQSIEVSVLPMLLSIVSVVIIPIVLGILFKYFFSSLSEPILPVLPSVSIIAIVTILACVVSSNSARILSSSLTVILVVILHNTGGYALGYMAARLLGMVAPKRSAIAVEVGMQNSGLATALAITHFSAYPMSAVPGALFSVWHNLSGAVFAGMLRKSAERGSRQPCMRRKHHGRQ